MPLSKGHIWLTAAETNEDARKCLVLATSLRQSVTTKEIVILVASQVESHLRNLLYDEFDKVYVLERLPNLNTLTAQDVANLPVLKSVVKCVFLHPNFICFENADGIFNMKSDDRRMFAIGQPDQLIALPGHKTLAQDGGNLHKIVRLAQFQEDPLTLVEKWRKVDKSLVGLLETFAVEKWLDIYAKLLPRFSDNDIEGSSHFQQDSDMVAIVGMSCRYPGANNLEEFWQVLINAEDATGNPPPFRWQRDQTIANDGSENRDTNAGFIKVPIDEFDAKFFGMSPKEIICMDPQQRLLLELIWEGLESAAIDPTALRGSTAGVFMGSWKNEFEEILVNSGEREVFRKYMGNSIGANAAKISFMLGLTGPSIGTESACSSSMVAVHLACKSLLREETNLALACGVNVLVNPFDESFMKMVISPDGHCKTFDASANGFARAEGCGVLVLKRLTDAVRDNDKIWALIRGTGMSQEGISPSMGTPTLHCESQAMEAAIADARVATEEVTYIEAHGTGTAVGDPIEVSAIAKAYYSKNRQEPLIIGSVKPNVGHTESCSGLTGIMKVVLAMNNDVIPAQQQLNNLNPAIDLTKIPAVIPLTPKDWKRIPGKPRIAGVSSFGISGTDAHVVVQEAPIGLAPKFTSQLDRPMHLVKLTAKTEEALHLLVGKYQQYLPSTADKIGDIAYTGNVGRGNFAHRAVAVVDSKDGLVKAIEKNELARKKIEGDPGKVCFLFTGQGSQYHGMSKQLYETSPIFRIHFDHCERILREQYKICIKTALWGENTGANRDEINRTIYSQTSIFCVGYALARLWESWGVRPDYVLGHSLGEFAAAVCANVLTVEDAIKLVAERSRLIDALPRGKMLVIRADKKTVEDTMKDFTQQKRVQPLDYAAVNANDQTVVAGDTAVVTDFSTFCKTRNLKCIMLSSTHAFHSSHMDPMLEEYRRIAKTTDGKSTPGATSPQYISGLRGGLLESGQLNANYWVDHTRQKVNFLFASQQLPLLGCKILVEIGPQPVLVAMAMMNNSEPLLCLPSIKRAEKEWTTLCNTVSKLYLEGVAIDWNGFDRHYSRTKVQLPTYPFIKRKFWPNMVHIEEQSIHPLLGSSIPNASSTKLFSCALNTQTDLAYIKDHAIGPHVIFPGAGYLEMCLAGGNHAFTTSDGISALRHPTLPVKVENLNVETPLRLEENKPCQVQVVVNFNTGGGSESGEDWKQDVTVTMYHKLDSDASVNKWLQHAHGTFTPYPEAEETQVDFSRDTFKKLQLILMSGTEGVGNVWTVKEIYDRLSSLGLRFGPVFRSLEKVYKDDTTLVAKVTLPEGDGAQYIVHPVVLDAMIQAVMILKQKDSKGLKKLHVPVKVGKFIWLGKQSWNASPDVFIYAYQDSVGNNTALLVTGQGQLLGFMEKVEFIDTSVKTVEAVLDQQSSQMPELWDETWKQQLGSNQERLQFEQNYSGKFYSDEFQQNMGKAYNKVTDYRLDVFSCLEQFTYYNMLKVLYLCGWNPKLGEEISATKLITQFNILEKHEKFLNCFLGVFQQNGVLDLVGVDKWKVVESPPNLAQVESRLKEPTFQKGLYEKFASAKVMENLGDTLHQIFRDKLTALSVLFAPSGNTNPWVEDFYDDYRNNFQVETMVRSVITQRFRHWLDQQQKQRDKLKLRIVEIGAGTGSATMAFFEAMEELGINYEYTYTDISPAFFPAAEKKFGKYKKNIIFKKLNIEEDPTEQGFIPEYYDYAIAYDVIHATKDLSETLRNVRVLLRNKGSFDMWEQTRVNSIITFVFGPLEGFWRFEDFNLRKDHCTLTIPGWTKVFNQVGFNMAGVFPCMNEFDALMCAQRTDEIEIPIAPKDKKVWVIFAGNESSQISHHLGQKLTSLGKHVVTVRHSEIAKQDGPIVYIREDSKGDIERVLSEAASGRKSVEGIIYGWALDKTKSAQTHLLQPYFHMAQAISGLKQASLPRIFALTSGIAPVGDNELSHFHPATLWGFTKTMKNENPDLSCRCIDIAGATEETLEEIFHEIWRDDKETQVALYKGARYVPRFTPHKLDKNDLPLPQGTNRFKLTLPATKSISDLQFESLEHFSLDPDEVEVEVKTAALNFRDVFAVLKPTEKFKHVNGVGNDFAGVVTRVGSQVTSWKVGDAVFGVNTEDIPLPSHVKIHELDLQPVLPGVTMAEACTLPAVFCTAYYCLVDVAKITPNDVVLIHTASGGVGLAAIDIVKHVGSTIIGTAGSKRKQNYLKSLGIKHIFNSRATDYQQQIMNVTNGTGVTVVLNSLTNPGFKEASLASCAKGARFIEMSKLDIWQPAEVKALRPDVDYQIVDLQSFEARTDWRRLMGKLKELLACKAIRPIPSVRFDSVNIREALIYLQKARHIGKVVCAMPEQRLEGGVMRSITPLFNDRSTYLITGGLNGIGFEVAKWMLSSGAKTIVLASRSPPTESTRAIINQYNSNGANLVTLQCDVGQVNDVRRLLAVMSEGLNLPPLKGIMHSAGTLHDGMINNQVWPTFCSTFNAKIAGTINLHECTKNYQLEHFVVYSSMTALFGSPGQGNHAAGNTFEDAYIQYRHSIGLPGTSINWGPWGQVGVAVEIELPGIKSLSNVNGISTLEYALKSQTTQICAMNVESFMAFSKRSSVISVYLDEKVWKSATAAAGMASSVSGKVHSFWQEYDAKQDVAEKAGEIQINLRNILRKILKMEPEEEINDESTFQELGVDSLMFVEIKNSVHALLGERVQVGTEVLREYNSVALLTNQLLKMIEGGVTQVEVTQVPQEPEDVPTMDEVKQWIREDSTLPDHITAAGKSVVKIDSVKTVLVTGVTGTLGPHIVQQLSVMPRISTIYCLVRSRQGKSGEIRFKNALKENDLLESTKLSKVVCIEGNVVLPHLGLDGATWTKLSSEVGAVVHVAATVNHLEHYRKNDSTTDVRGANVKGTKNILEFATSTVVKHVFCASSILTATKSEADGTLSESWPQISDYDNITTFAYPVSKFVGDVILKTAVERGIPCKVFRFPLISGDSRTGRCTLDHNHLMLRYLFIMKAGVIQVNPLPVIMVPVDKCAEVSLQLFFHPYAPNEAYNITHHNPLVDQEFEGLSRKLGYPVIQVPLSEFSKRLRRDTDTPYAMFKDLYQESDEETYVFQFLNTPALQRWKDGVENFWVSKKVAKFASQFYTNLQPSMDYLERDLLFAKSTGWFGKFGL